MKSISSGPDSLHFPCVFAMVLQQGTIHHNLCGFTAIVAGMTYKGFPKLLGYPHSCKNYEKKFHWALNTCFFLVWNFCSNHFSP
jgi:hypothetical protein